MLFRNQMESGKHKDQFKANCINCSMDQGDAVSLVMFYMALKPLSQIFNK